VVTVFWAVVGLLWVSGVLWLVVSEARKSIRGKKEE
jgi:hypothetical protein